MYIIYHVHLFTLSIINIIMLWPAAEEPFDGKYWFWRIYFKYSVLHIVDGVDLCQEVFIKIIIYFLFLLPP